MRNMLLTCETDNCSNKGIAIELATDATTYCCGACGQLITNAVEKTDGSAETSE